MNLDRFSLFLKMLLTSYSLKREEIDRISTRLLADEEEFNRVWRHFQDRQVLDGVDDFRPILEDLLL